MDCFWIDFIIAFFSDYCTFLFVIVMIYNMNK
jgi:hypothetical protein